MGIPVELDYSPRVWLAVGVPIGGPMGGETEGWYPMQGTFADVPPALWGYSTSVFLSSVFRAVV